MMLNGLVLARLWISLVCCLLAFYRVSNEAVLETESGVAHSLALMKPSMWAQAASGPVSCAGLPATD